MFRFTSTLYLLVVTVSNSTAYGTSIPDTALSVEWKTPSSSQCGFALTSEIVKTDRQLDEFVKSESEHVNERAKEEQKTVLPSASTSKTVNKEAKQLNEREMAAKEKNDSTEAKAGAATHGEKTADKAEAERLAKQAADKAEAERLAKQAADKAEAERLAKQAADKAEAERLAKQAADKAEAERLAKESPDKAEAARLAKEAADEARKILEEDPQRARKILDMLSSIFTTKEGQIFIFVAFLLFLYIFLLDGLVGRCYKIKPRQVEQHAERNFAHTAIWENPIAKNWYLSAVWATIQHRQLAEFYENRAHKLNVLRVILITAVTSSAITSMGTSEHEEDFELVFAIVGMIGSLLTAVISTLDYASLGSKHRYAEHGFAKVKKNMELLLNKCTEKPCIKDWEQVKASMDEVDAKAPPYVPYFESIMGDCPLNCCSGRPDLSQATRRSANPPKSLLRSPTQESKDNTAANSMTRNSATNGHGVIGVPDRLETVK